MCLFYSSSDWCYICIWQKGSIDTIRNVANVCCVQLSHSSHLLAFGSADYKIYCYDLRNTRIPWCTLSGHGKAISYVKFLDSETIVSASTDNTLKLWDLKRTNPSGLSTNACSLTLSGHTNEKVCFIIISIFNCLKHYVPMTIIVAIWYLSCSLQNFVGLSVCDGYILCGSETNEVSCILVAFFLWKISPYCSILLSKKREYIIFYFRNMKFQNSRLCASWKRVLV